jgi:hypothetical protein
MITTTACDLNEVEFVSRDVGGVRENGVGSVGWGGGAVKWCDRGMVGWVPISNRHPEVRALANLEG